MRVVSQQSNADLDRHFATREVEAAIVELAANLLRVIRGAGRPVEIAPQALRYVRAAQGYYDVTKTWPANELHELLDASNPRYERYGESDDRSFELAIDTMVRGSLQIAASRLLAQRAQESAGETQLHDGITAREDAIERRTRAFEAARKASAKPRSGRTKPRANTFD